MRTDAEVVFRLAVLASFAAAFNGCAYLWLGLIISLVATVVCVVGAVYWFAVWAGSE